MSVRLLNDIKDKVVKARVKAEDCKIKVIGYFHEYMLNFDVQDVIEIEIEDDKIMEEKK